MRILIGVFLGLMALFLILIVLVQRGRGGGLTGALGGPGGQSAFGSKAGDLFTKITVWTAGLWILSCIGSILYFAGGSDALSGAEDKPPAATTDTGAGTGTGPAEAVTPAEDTQE
jgi:preprotein translocase subunit SecG